jgi:hypothetical protein
MIPTYIESPKLFDQMVYQFEDDMCFRPFDWGLLYMPTLHL